MSDITVVPSVLIHRIVDGASMTGVDPTDGVIIYEFDYDGEVGGPFSVGEELSWTGGKGVLLVLVDSGSTGTLTVVSSSGVAPSDGMSITGGSSSAICDVDGAVVTIEGEDSETTIRRGRYRVYSNLTDCGLITIPESVAFNGYRIRNALVNAPGISAVDFYIVDRDGNSVSAGSITLTSGAGYNEWRNGGLIVAPGCKFKAVGTGTASADGEIMFILGEGWGASIFDQAGELGSSNLPPGMVRP